MVSLMRNLYLVQSIFPLPALDFRITVLHFNTNVYLTLYSHIPSNVWIIDTRITNHIYHDLAMFSKTIFFFPLEFYYKEKFDEYICQYKTSRKFRDISKI